jgi:hypothetical protein
MNKKFINFFEKLSKNIFNYSNEKIKKFFELNNKKKIHWFSITYLENDNYLDMNFYFRDENISDAILQYLQIPLQLYFPKN